MTKGRFSVRRSSLPGVEFVEADSPMTFSRHTHDQFGIGMIVRGAQHSASGRGQVEAVAGDIITVNPGEVHDGAPLGSEGRHWRMLYLDTSVIIDIAGDILGHTRDVEFRHPVLTQRKTAMRFSALYRSLHERQTLDAMEPESLLFRVVEKLVMEKPDDATVNFPSSIRRAKSRIDDAPADPLTLDDLARAAGVGKFQLLRGFARMTGLTPHAYMMQARTNLARGMIRRGQSLADAANASGFADQSHMTRMFSRAYGVTPGAYAEAFR
jgi:AraC-like DNA-binding protein